MIATANAASKPLTLVALGDSLTAGYGLAQSEAFPVVLETRLKDLGLDVTVINGGVSGDTASGGLERLGLAWLTAGCVLLGLFPVAVMEVIDPVTQTLLGRGLAHGRMREAAGVLA